MSFIPWWHSVLFSVWFELQPFGDSLNAWSHRSAVSALNSSLLAAWWGDWTCDSHLASFIAAQFPTVDVSLHSHAMCQTLLLFALVLYLEIQITYQTILLTRLLNAKIYLHLIKQCQTLSSQQSLSRALVQFCSLIISNWDWQCVESKKLNMWSNIDAKWSNWSNRSRLNHISLSLDHIFLYFLC